VAAGISVAAVTRPDRVVGTLRAALVLSLLSLLATPGLAAQDTVRVLSYNIRHGAGMDDSLDLRRAAAVIVAQKPDVVLLQEIDVRTERTGGVDQPAALAELTGMPYHAFGKFMDYLGGQYGMAILSATPILDSTTHVLPEGEEPRSALAARIRPKPQAPVMVFVDIHLYRTADERLAQAHRLVQIFANERRPVVLVGDFNSQPGGSVLELLSRHWTLPQKPRDAHFTFPADHPAREIDFVLYRPANRFRVLDYQVVDERVASDHRPVLIVLEVHRSTRQ
jgi:endonuclease/exonuclease/phosphatase family metal-dependent hydrolase